MYRLKMRRNLAQDTSEAETSHILEKAKRPTDASGNLLPEYDGLELTYYMHGTFPGLYQAAPRFEDWVNDPERTGNEAQVDFWRKMGRAEITRHFDFVREYNAEVGDWYKKVTAFSSSLLRGMSDSANAVVGELSSWPNFEVPPEVIQEIIAYLQEWITASSDAESHITLANTLLQDQLVYNESMISEGLRYADVLHESYESEVAALRNKVRELEAEVLRLMDENIRLREKLSEQGDMMQNLLTLLQEGGKAAGGVIDKIGDNASKIAAPLAFGGVSAILLYAGIGLAAFFLLRKI